MPSVMKTLFLNPPSFEKFDGGAGSRWPATREIESYWYPVWLASQDIDFVVRGEFDHAVVEYAQGKPLSEILSASYMKDGKVVHNPPRALLQTAELDELPFATEVYQEN